MERVFRESFRAHPPRFFRSVPATGTCGVNLFQTDFSVHSRSVTRFDTLALAFSWSADSERVERVDAVFVAVESFLHHN